MTIAEYFKDIELKPDFTGYITTDDMILAIDISGEDSGETLTGNEDVSNYAIAYMGFTNRSSSLNPTEQTHSYYIHGQSTVKTGNQRTIDFEADRYVGDAFQDFVLSHKMKYAKGQDAVVKYVYLDRVTGKGEIGRGTLSITDDGSGAPENNLTVAGSIKKTGADPVEFQYKKSA